MSDLTTAQRHVLEELKRRPSGSYFREDAEKNAILELASETMVCDPHETGSAMFTRATEKGLAALAASPAPLDTKTPHTPSGQILAVRKGRKIIFDLETFSGIL